jgi:hypothetical protein
MPVLVSGRNVTWLRRRWVGTATVKNRLPDNRQFSGLDRLGHARLTIDEQGLLIFEVTILRRRWQVNRVPNTALSYFLLSL